MSSVVLVKGEMPPKKKEIERTGIIVSLEESSERDHINLVLDVPIQGKVYAADITDDGIILHNVEGELPDYMLSRSGYIKIQRD